MRYFLGLVVVLGLSAPTVAHSVEACNVSGVDDVTRQLDVERELYKSVNKSVVLEDPSGRTITVTVEDVRVTQVKGEPMVVVTINNGKKKINVSARQIKSVRSTSQASHASNASVSKLSDRSRTEIERALVYAKKQSPDNLSGGLYEYHPAARNLSPEMAGATETSLDTARYLGFEKIDGGEFMYEAHLAGAGFLKDGAWIKTQFPGHAGFAEASNTAKVYLSVDPAKLSAELPHIVKSARKSNAATLKVGSNGRILRRSDRLVVYFETPEEAAKFAKSMAEDFAIRGVKGDRVPFTHQLGDTPVSVGIDPRAGVSWRSRVASELGDASKKCGVDTDCIAVYLRGKGIDPDHWLPIDAVDKVVPITGTK